jgi:ribonuclease Y
MTTRLWIMLLGSLLAGTLLGLLIGFWGRKRIVEKQFESIRNYSKKIINEAHKRAKALKKEAAIRAKDTVYQMKLDFEKETQEKKEQLTAQERRLFHKEESLDKKI